jgi:hypothetical protein
LTSYSGMIWSANASSIKVAGGRRIKKSFQSRFKGRFGLDVLQILPGIPSLSPGIEALSGISDTIFTLTFCLEVAFGGRG